MAGQFSTRTVLISFLARQGFLAPIRLVQLLFEPMLIGKIWRQLSKFRRNHHRLAAKKEVVQKETPEVSTDRFKVRLSPRNDLQDIFQLVPPKKFAGPLENLPFWRREFSMALEIINSKMNFSIVDADTDKLIGHFSLTEFRIEDQVENELGYRIHYHRYGEGLATEAAKVVKKILSNHYSIDRLVSIIDPRNIASVKVAKKNGMVFEKEWFMNKDLYHVYAIEP